jgi:hypothetical protein
VTDHEDEDEDEDEEDDGDGDGTMMTGGGSRDLRDVARIV